MKITVKIKPNAKEERVEKTGENSYSVWVRQRLVEGRANEALVKVLAEHFGVSKSAVVLVKGRTSRQKLFEVRGV
jgi:uncharacterized protein (TIGR00251 family)